MVLSCIQVPAEERAERTSWMTTTRDEEQGEERKERSRFRESASAVIAMSN
jgi:hypothetical protein